jgi:acyl-CoA ligase (AMP-forming) (exosortase A-associated)
VARVARGLITLGLEPHERVGIYMPKRIETVTALFGTSLAAGAFVPINPALKPDQVGHILRDCGVRILVTSPERLALLRGVLDGCSEVKTVVAVDTTEPPSMPPHIAGCTWGDLSQAGGTVQLPRTIDTDITSILYTSGSTGKPKGVVLSQRNMVTGAKSVAEYLENHRDDRVLAVLPLSFDYGLSQLTTAFLAGARAVLVNYALARQVLDAVTQHRVTGLAAVPTLWIQLARLEWPPQVQEHLRYVTNSGGAMPQATLEQLKGRLPGTRIFLMYGLTEAFRSTYLSPEELDHRPDSIGKAIPNAEVLVVREDGTPCAPHEPGELVHRGSLVTQGYWNAPEATAVRFRPSPVRDPAVPVPEIAVWSGDTVRMDEEGYLYFVGRKDEMIKTSGYRVSPTEVEEVVYASGLVAEAVALGIPHPELGQAIVVVATPAPEHAKVTPERVLSECKRKLASYMVPETVLLRDSLPRNPNGKFDRGQLAAELRELFSPDGRAP